MHNQTLLYITSEAIDADELQAILDTARPLDAHILCMVISIMPAQPMNAYGHVAYAGVGFATEWLEELQKRRSRLKDSGEHVEALLEKAGVSGDVHTVFTTYADVQVDVARRAMISDTATISAQLRDSDPDLFRSAAYGVLFDSPTGLVLNAPVLTAPKRVLVAWNWELPSARAIHAALPLLIGADEVIVGIVDPHSSVGVHGEDPGADLAKWLSHRGCTVSVGQYPSGGADTATVLAERAVDLGVDLIVMGAFGRSRMRELVFGGTTDSMLRRADVPLFMAH